MHIHNFCFLWGFLFNLLKGSMQGLSDIWVLKRNQGFVCALSIIGLPLVTY